MLLLPTASWPLLEANGSQMMLLAVILEISAKATKSAKLSNGSFAVGALQLAP